MAIGCEKGWSYTSIGVLGAATNWFEKRIKDLDLTELGRVRPDSGDVAENIFIWNDQNSPKSAGYKKR